MASNGTKKRAKGVLTLKPKDEPVKKAVKTKPPREKRYPVTHEPFWTCPGFVSFNVPETAQPKPATDKIPDPYLQMTLGVVGGGFRCFVSGKSLVRRIGETVIGRLVIMKATYEDGSSYLYANIEIVANAVPDAEFTVMKNVKNFKKNDNVVYTLPVAGGIAIVARL